MGTTIKIRGNMNTRKFHKTIISVEVLSEAPFDPCNLSDVHYAITDGDCSGRWKVVGKEELDGRTAAIELMRQGSAPEFFGLDDDGEDL
jgi:hypothetical protein